MEKWLASIVFSLEKVMTEILLLVVIEFFILGVFFLFVGRCKIGFFSMFFLVYTLFIYISTLLITLDINGILSLSFIGKDVTSHYRASFGKDDISILILTTLYQALLLIGGMFAYSLKGSVKARSENNLKVKRTDNRVPTIVTMLLICITYTIIRIVITKDFPLYIMLTHGINQAVRDVAFEYASNRSVPFLFLPSIFQNFYRVLIPFLALLLISISHTSAKKIKYFAYAALFYALILNIGSMKRAPIIYMLMWFFVYLNLFNTRKTLWFLGKSSILFIVIMSIITYFYSGNVIESVISTLARIFVIEGLSEYLALFHFGNDFDHLYHKLPLFYINRIISSDSISFSEWWKYSITDATTRGYSSIGILAELWVMAGYISLLFIPVIGYLLYRADYKVSKTVDAFSTSFISGLIIIIAFSAVKGIFSQMLAGGGLLLILLYNTLKYSSPKRSK